MKYSKVKADRDTSIELSAEGDTVLYKFGHDAIVMPLGHGSIDHVEAFAAANSEYLGCSVYIFRHEAKIAPNGILVKGSPNVSKPAYEVVETHISLIDAGDTVVVNGELTTVCKKDIRRCSFMGLSLFGDNYNSGTKPVRKAINLSF